MRDSTSRSVVSYIYVYESFDRFLTHDNKLFLCIFLSRISPSYSLNMIILVTLFYMFYTLFSFTSFDFLREIYTILSCDKYLSTWYYKNMILCIWIYSNPLSGYMRNSCPIRFHIFSLVPILISQNTRKIHSKTILFFSCHAPMKYREYTP